MRRKRSEDGGLTARAPMDLRELAANERFVRGQLAVDSDDLQRQQVRLGCAHRQGSAALASLRGAFVPLRRATLALVRDR
jgi:hypothetical protein